MEHEQQDEQVEYAGTSLRLQNGDVVEVINPASKFFLAALGVVTDAGDTEAISVNFSGVVNGVEVMDDYPMRQIWLRKVG